MPPSAGGALLPQQAPLLNPAGVPLSWSYDAYGRLTAYVAPSATMTMRTSGTDERVEAVAGAVARRFAYSQSQRTLVHLSPGFDRGPPSLPPEIDGSWPGQHRSPDMRGACAVRLRVEWLRGTIGERLT